MANSNAILKEVLDQIHPNRIPVDQKQAMNAFRQEVVQFLQQRFSLHHERIGEPRSIGSTEKGTETALSYDIDVILPFRNGYRSSAQKVKAEVFSALRTQFPNPPTLVRDQRVSVGLRRKWKNSELGIDIVPGLERSPNSYVQGDTNPEKTFLVLYDRESNAERLTNVDLQIRMVKQNMLNYRDTVRLLKAWRHKQGHIIGSYALELLVYQATKGQNAPKTGSPEVMLRHVLKWAIPFLESDGQLQDTGANYPWPDYLKTGAKTQLAGLWRKLLNALDSGDSTVLKGYFL